LVFKVRVTLHCIATLSDRSHHALSPAIMVASLAHSCLLILLSVRVSTASTPIARIKGPPIRLSKVYFALCFLLLLHILIEPINSIVIGN